MVLSLAKGEQKTEGYTKEESCIFTLFSYFIKNTRNRYSRMSIFFTSGIRERWPYFFLILFLIDLNYVIDCQDFFEPQELVSGHVGIHTHIQTHTDTPGNK